MEIQVGDVWAFPTGEAFKLEKYDYPDGRFSARMRHMETKEYGDYLLEGDAIKLPMYLKQQGAWKEPPPQ